MPISRRSVALGLPLLLGGCALDQPTNNVSGSSEFDPEYLTLYAALDNEPFPVPAIDLTTVEPRYLRRIIAFATTEQPGTMVVDPNERFLYLVREHGAAIRYGVGVGRVEAFNFQGAATIGRKAEWPHWTPTADMIAREPDRYGPVKDGLAGGEGNPLGPRALYLYKDGRDTLYRLHGTVEPSTIGTKVSSGCVRLLNQDIIDLYNRVPVGAKAIVLPATPSASS
jgi:lipoprotein-anchoring transpeptidase ErfK/SrfK